MAFPKHSKSFRKQGMLSVTKTLDSIQKQAHPMSVDVAAGFKDSLLSSWALSAIQWPWARLFNQLQSPWLASLNCVCVYVTHFNLCLAGASMEPCGGQKKVYRTQFSPTLWSLEFTLRTTSAANAFIHWAISLAPGHLNYTLTQVSFVFKRCRLQDFASSMDPKLSASDLLSHNHHNGSWIAQITCYTLDAKKRPYQSIYRRDSQYVFVFGK